MQRDFQSQTTKKISQNSDVRNCKIRRKIILEKNKNNKKICLFLFLRKY